MFGKGLKLFTLFGFTVKIDVSWLFIAFLVTWSLADGWFPTSLPKLSTTTYWLMGIAGALGLFASVVVHEFSHSLVARSYGIPMRGITLFIFGGVAEMSNEPPGPKEEFLMAVAGPVASVVTAGVAYGALLAGRGLGWPETVTAVLGYLAVINLALVAFNVMPAFPLDGGRMLRAALWRWKGNLRWATRVSSAIGGGFGAVLIGLGLLSLLVGNLVGGIWWILIGFFVRQAAQGSYRQLLMRRSLEGEPVRRFMKTDPVTVRRDLSIREVVEDYVYRHHYKMLPVVAHGELVGCVTTRRIKETPRDEWERQSVGSIVEPCSEENSISPDADAMEALSRMHRSRSSRLMVVEDGTLVGVLSLKDLLEFFSLKMELGDE